MFKKLFNCSVCPGHCAWDELFCWACRASIRASVEARQPVPPQAGLPRAFFAATSYEGANARYVKLLKAQPFNAPARDLVEPLERLAAHWRVELQLLRADAVVPVPSHPWRGKVETDLSRIWGRCVAEATQIPLWPEMLRHRWRAGSSQKALDRSGRTVSARGRRFALRGEPRPLARVLLVDDVCATGASLRACADLLRQSQMEVVGCFVLARVA